MMLAGTNLGDVAATLRIPMAELDDRLDRMIERLAVDVPAAAETAPRAAGRGL